MAELTVGQRVLLHLSRFTGLISEYEVPGDMTQEGIAKACGISRSHAAVEIKRLREKGLLMEELRHIKGGKTRRKVYFLTEDGIREKLAVLKFAEENGIDLSAQAPEKAGNERVFVGRERELAALGEWMNNGRERVLNLYGPAGIGKSTLLREFGERGDIMVFIHEIREIDSLRAVILHLADFLAARKFGRLKKSVEHGYDPGEVAYILSSGIKNLIIAIEGTDEDVLAPLIALLKGLPNGIKLVVITERAEELAAEQTVKYLEVPPLSKEEVRKLLERKDSNADAGEIMRETGGNPLLIEAHLTGQGGGDINEVMERVIEGLWDEDRKNMLAIAVSGDSISPDMVALSLPFVMREDGLRLHPLMREKLLRRASAEEIREAHIAAAGLSNSPLERLMHFLQAGDAERASGVLRREMVDITENHLYLLEGIIDEGMAVTPELKLLVADHLVQSGKRERALKLCEFAQNQAEPGSVTWVRSAIRIGRIHAMNMELDTAEEYYRKAVEISRRKMYIREEAVAQREWGALLLKRRDITDAKKHLGIALDLALMVKDEFLLSRIMVDKGNVKLASKDVKGAFSYYASSLGVSGDSTTPDKAYALAICYQKIEMFEALGNINKLALTYMDCARIYGEIGNMDRGAYYGHMALNLAQNMGSEATLRKIEESLKGLGIGQTGRD